MRRAAGLPVSQVTRHLVRTGNPGTGKTTSPACWDSYTPRSGSWGPASSSRSPGATWWRATWARPRSDRRSGQAGARRDLVDRRGLHADQAGRVGAGLRPGGGRHPRQADGRSPRSARGDRSGYGEEMAQLISSNPGLPSRFPRTISFPDYSTDELLSIFTACASATDTRPLPMRSTACAGTWAGSRAPRSSVTAGSYATSSRPPCRQASRIVTSGGSDLTTLTPKTSAYGTFRGQITSPTKQRRDRIYE